MRSCTECGEAIPENAPGCPRCDLPEAPAVATLPGRPTDFPTVDDLVVRLRRDLGREFEVHGELGRGGMAVVYKATELELLRPVALKVLPPDLSASNAMAERFRREARMAASLDHPNIIPIYRVGQAGGVFYIAMKFIEGRSLDDIIEAQGPLPIPVVLHVLRAAVQAIAFAHDHGVVHRDIKGANILVDQDGRVVVSDFGIARAGEDAGMTATGMLMGTPYFMSPEQCAGHRVGHQSDQYSLGVVAFQLLTGTVPFRAETLPGVMQHHFFTPPPDIRAVRADVPDELVALVRRALAKRASERYATTRDMQEAIEAIPFPDAMRRQGEAQLRDLVLGVPVARVRAGALPPLQETLLMTPPPGSSGAVTSARRRARMGLVLGGAAAMLLLAGLSWATTQRKPASSAAPAIPVPVPAGDSIASLVSAAPRDSGPPSEPSATLAGRRDVTQPDRVEPETTPPPPRAVTRDSGPSGKLRVRVQPSDAEIMVDGRVLGRGVVLDSAVAAGPRALRVTAPGYHALDTVISVRSGETNQIGTLRLVPLEQRP